MTGVLTEPSPVRCSCLPRKMPLANCRCQGEKKWQLQTRLPGPQEMRSNFWTQTNRAGSGWTRVARQDSTPPF